MGPRAGDELLVLGERQHDLSGRRKTEDRPPNHRGFPGEGGQDLSGEAPLGGEAPPGREAASGLGPRTRQEGGRRGRRAGVQRGGPWPQPGCLQECRGPRWVRHCNACLRGFSGDWGASEVLQRRRSLEMTGKAKRESFQDRNDLWGLLQRWVVLGSVPASDVLLSFLPSA